MSGDGPEKRSEAPRAAFSDATAAAAEPRVSVIVPAWRAAATLPTCLAAIRRSEPAAAEVIVVVDGGAEGESETIATIAAGQGARTIVLAERRGAAAARNAGAAAAVGAILVFVDADVAPAPEAIGRLVRTLDDEPDLAACFGSYDAAPTATNLASQYKNLLHHFVHQRGREEAETFWSGLGAIRRDAFEAVAGFDAERYRNASVEDIELGYRLRARGLRIRLVKAAQGTHLKRWTVGGVLATDLLHRALPWSELILRSPRRMRELNLSRRHRAGVIATGLLAVGLVGAAVDARLVWVSALGAAAALAVGSDFLAFLARERGLGRALAAAPLHLAYFVTSGLGFALAVARHAARRMSASAL